MGSNLIDEETVNMFCDARFWPAMHAKRCRSVAYGVLGVVHGDDVSVAGIGRGMARVRGTSPKHGIKQVDRLLSNEAVSMDAAFAGWVPWIVGDRESIVVAMDWTEHDHDDQATISLHLVTRHGRATPLVWKTVIKSTLKGKRNQYEDEALLALYHALPPDVEVTILADRGFGDTALYAGLHELGFHYVIRFRGCIHVETNDGRMGPVSELLPVTGEATRFDDVGLTLGGCTGSSVVVVHDHKMKDPWYLATDRPDPARRIMKLYGRRFSIEETYRDEKDPHFGLGLSATHIGRPDRRDRLLLLIAIAHALCTLLGRAGESLGPDKQLRANTAKKRTHSLFRQGREYVKGVLFKYGTKLRRTFLELLRSHQHETSTYAWI